MLHIDVPVTEWDEASLKATIWDGETGETFFDALERFKTFGPLFDAAHAITLDPEQEIMSFGYGDDPEGFDGIEVGVLIEAMEEGEETLRDLDTTWGPFAIWEVQS